MALSVKLQQRQTQNLALTPQMLQSIKLLQMSTLDLRQRIAEEIEKNPLLELDEGQGFERGDGYNGGSDESKSLEQKDGGLKAEVSSELDVSQSALERKLDTTFENEFDEDRSGGAASKNTGQSSGTDFSRGSGEQVNFEEFVASDKTLREHLSEQLALTKLSQIPRMVAIQIIDSLDEDGFLRRPIEEIASECGADIGDAQEGLSCIQQFDPPGIGARNLGECLAIQLREKNRFDPAMGMLLKNLELLAKRDFEQLQEICDVSFDDLLDMVEEVRALDPRPARAFENVATQTVIPDVIVRDQADGSFAVELNSHAMPKVLVNQTYASIVAHGPNAEEQNAFVAECQQNANWLVRSLEQRAQTILKVMTEIVRQQDGFFVHGVSHLKPMSLKQVADAIKMHESTVSRVTTEKYVQTKRGTYELKYFFTAAIGSLSDDGQAHSAESVRQRIRLMIEAETADNVLSDDAIVETLKGEGVDIARRTVAKYRESMNLPSSVQRRREKRAMARR